MVQYAPTVDRAFAALADPTRRPVLERLGEGAATISELADPCRRTHERSTMSTSVTTPNELEIRVERIFDAPRTHVFSV